MISLFLLSLIQAAPILEWVSGWWSVDEYLILVQKQDVRYWKASTYPENEKRTFIEWARQPRRHGQRSMHRVWLTLEGQQLELGRKEKDRFYQYTNWKNSNGNGKFKTWWRTSPPNEKESKEKIEEKDKTKKLKQKSDSESENELAKSEDESEDSKETFSFNPDAEEFVPLSPCSADSNFKETKNLKEGNDNVLLKHQMIVENFLIGSGLKEKLTGRFVLIENTVEVGEILIDDQGKGNIFPYQRPLKVTGGNVVYISITLAGRVILKIDDTCLMLSSQSTEEELIWKYCKPKAFTLNMRKLHVD